MKETTRARLVLILVGLMVVLGLPLLTGADDEGYRSYLPIVARHRHPPPATGWAVGDSVGDGYAVIIHTTDGGETWIRQGKAGEIPDVNLVKVAAIDAQNAWVTGDHGTILHTTDGGRSWERQAVPAEVSDVTLWGVYAVDRKTAWVTGYQGTILRTTDGGRTWTRQGQGVVPSGAQMTGIYASDADHAWAVDGSLGAGYVYHTVDGGGNWQKAHVPCEVCDYIIWPHGVDDNTVWIAANGAVIHTADGGQTWDVQLEGGFGDFNCVFALDRDTIWAAFDPQYAYRSTDGGETWPHAAYIPEQKLLHISAVDRQTAWTVGAGRSDQPGEELPGQVLFTAYGNQTWTVQTTPVQTQWWGVSFVR